MNIYNPQLFPITSASARKESLSSSESIIRAQHSDDDKKKRGEGEREDSSSIALKRVPTNVSLAIKSCHKEADFRTHGTMHDHYYSKDNVK